MRRPLSDYEKAYRVFYGESAKSLGRKPLGGARRVPITFTLNQETVTAMDAALSGIRRSIWIEEAVMYRLAHPDNFTRLPA